MSGWAAYGGQSGVITTEQDGSDLRLLAQEGITEALTWSSALPGGDSTLNMTISQDSRYRTPGTNAGLLVTVFRGDVQWQGTLAEPQPHEGGGWDVTAQGCGTYGNNFRAISGGGSGGQGGTPASADAMVQDAIGRGLRWTKWANLDGIAGLDRTQLFEKGSKSVTEALNSFCAGSSDGSVPISLTWAVVGRKRQLQIFPLPRVITPTRLLITADPVGRALAGYYNAMYVRYQSSTDDPNSSTPAAYELSPAVTLPAMIGKHGRLEGYADFSNAGQMSPPDPTNRAGKILGTYQAISYTQTFTATPGMALTLGGTPVDLGTERAGEVYRVLGAGISAGGEVNAADQVIFPAAGTRGMTWRRPRRSSRISRLRDAGPASANLSTAAW